MTAAQIVPKNGAWGDSDTPNRFHFEVLDDDGCVARCFNRDGTGEVDVIAREVLDQDRNPVPVIFPFKFASLDIAEEAGQKLRAVFAEVKAMMNWERPENCAHPQTLEQRFSRTTPSVEMCTACGATLREIPIEEARANRAKAAA